MAQGKTKPYDIACLAIEIVGKVAEGKISWDEAIAMQYRDNRVFINAIEYQVAEYRRKNPVTTNIRIEGYEKWKAAQS